MDGGIGAAGIQRKKEEKREDKTVKNPPSRPGGNPGRHDLFTGAEF
jgi:hypothetical protein